MKGIGIFGAAMAFCASTAFAQAPPPPAFQAATPSNFTYAPTYAEQVYGGTAEGRLLRGVGALVRSAGEANLLGSEAAKNYEQARSMAIDNRLKAVASYYELRDLNKEWRFGDEGVTEEQLFRINQARLPPRLTPVQLDPVTGQINWPVMLRLERFASERGLVEEAFATRATYGGFASHDQYLKLRSMLERMMSLLSDYVDEAPPSDYAAARVFLSSLEHEAQMTVD